MPSILSVLFLLPGCGFEPVYADREHSYDTIEALAAVAIDTPSGKEGELLRAELQDRFNPESRPAPVDYRLKIALEPKFEPFIIEADGTASRFSITYHSPYTLTRLADNRVISQGRVRRQVSYNVSEDDDYSTFVAQQDAIRRLIIELAEDYKMRIGAELARR